MSFYTETNKENFLNKLHTLEQAIAEGKLITNHLEVIEKNGFKWRVLCLLRPFFALFSCDTLSHVRVNHVKESLLKYFRANHQFLDKTTIKNFNEHFLDPLNKKKSTFNLSSTDLKSFIPLLPLKWPADLKEISITEKEKQVLESAFFKVLPSFSEGYHVISCIKKKIDGNSKRILQNDIQKENEICEIPFTVKVNIQSNRKKSYIHLWTKAIIGEGGQRKVKLCYDLLTGKSVIRKKCCSKIEELILSHFQVHPSPGIEPIKHIERCEKSFKNQHIIQERFDCDLTTRLRKSELLPKHVYSIMDQLVTGLSALHDFRPIDISQSWEGLKITTTTTTYPYAFHLDIKPSNILIRHQNSDNIEAFLSDFGTSNNLIPGSGTIGYTPPEDIKLLSFSYPNGLAGGIQNISKKDLAKQVVDNAQKKDVWELGLVFAELLTGQVIIITKRNPGQPESERRIPPLHCISNALCKGSKNGHDDYFIGEITQNDVNKDIAELKEESKQEYAPIWDHLIIKMLQVDPEKRISAKKALEIYSGLKML